MELTTARAIVPCGACNNPPLLLGKQREASEGVAWKGRGEGVDCATAVASSYRREEESTSSLLPIERLGGDGEGGSV